MQWEMRLKRFKSGNQVGLIVSKPDTGIDSEVSPNIAGRDE